MCIRLLITTPVTARLTTHLVITIRASTVAIAIGISAAMVRIITGVAITAGTIDLQVIDEKPFIGYLFQCVS